MSRSVAARGWVVAIALLVACHTSEPQGAAPGSPGSPAKATPVPVEVERVKPGPLDRTLEAVGQVQTLDSVEIRPEMPGIIDRIAFDDGARVRRGQILVTLNAAEAKAGLADARARERLARLDLDRAKALFARGDLAKAELDRAEANAALAHAAIDRAQEIVRKTKIVAPLDGVLGRREVSLGAAVDPGQRIARLDVVDPLVVEVAFPESAAGQIAVGQVAKITLDRGEAIEGKVRFVAPRLDAASRTLAVRVEVANSEGKLVPGMTARASIVTGHRDDALLVPTEAVAQTARGPAVWVVGADNKVEIKTIQVGERLAARVEVVDGLVAGDAVVVAGLARLKPGADVAIVAGKAKSESPR